MQLLGRLMNHVLEQRGLGATIVGATSATRAPPRSKRLPAEPGGCVHPLSRWARLRRAAPPDDTVADDNIHAIALRGTFDDAQSILKACFATAPIASASVSRRQFDQLGAGRRADGLLFHQRRCAWRAVSRGFLRRPDRQFRRCAGGLCGEAHGPAAVAADRRDQRQRHSGARAGERALRATRRHADAVAVDGHSAHPTSSACCSTRWTRRRGIARGFASLDHPAASIFRGGAGSDPRGFRRARGQRSRNQRRDRPHLSRVGLCARPHTATGVHAARARLAVDPSTPVVALATAHPAKFPRRSSAPSASASSCRRVSRQFLPPRSGSPVETMKGAFGLHRGPRARDAPRDKV